MSEHIWQYFYSPARDGWGIVTPDGYAVMLPQLNEYTAKLIVKQHNRIVHQLTEPGK